jgi:hypothetical protein
MFLLTYGHEILDYFCLNIYIYIYLIGYKLKLVNSLIKNNKHWRTWIYGVYFQQNNTCHKIWKIQTYFKYRVGGILGWLFIYLFIYYYYVCGECYWYTSIESKNI